RGDEIAGLAARRAYAVVQLAHHLRELPLRACAFALEAPDLALHPAQPLLDRLHEPLDLLGAFGHLPRGTLLLGAALLGEPVRGPGAGRSRGSAGGRPARSTSPGRAAAGGWPPGDGRARTRRRRPLLGDLQLSTARHSCGTPPLAGRPTTIERNDDTRPGRQ